MKSIFLTYFLSPVIILVLSLLEFTPLRAIVAPLASAPTTAGPIYLNFLLENQNISHLATYSMFGMFSTIFALSVYVFIISSGYNVYKSLMAFLIYVFCNVLLISFQSHISIFFIEFGIFLMCFFALLMPKYNLELLPRKKINIFIKVLSAFVLINIVVILKQQYIDIAAIISAFPVGAISLILPLHFLENKQYVINFLQKYIVFSLSLLGFFFVISMGDNSLSNFLLAVATSIVISVFLYFYEARVSEKLKENLNKVWLRRELIRR